MQKLAGYSDVNITLSAAKGTPLTQNDLDRIKLLVEKNVPLECPGRFKTVDCDEPGEATMSAVVEITKYDERNAFARYMLAGLGQMHIQATVTLSDYKSGELIARSDVSKTFAWGGLYGAFTKIQEIEDGFAKAVAASFLEKKQQYGAQ
jgi:hypothetical protein